MTKLYLDIETRSRQDLKKVGVYRYSECPDFDILMCSWALDDGPITTAFGPDVFLLPGLAEQDVVKVAWNAQFERVCYSRSWNAGWLDPASWHDPMVVAAEKGYPVSLAAAASSLGAEPKDEAGSRLIALFCKPNKHGEFNTPQEYPLEWLDFIAYCEQDVSTLRDLDLRLGDFPSLEERQAWVTDQHINDTGFAIDAELCHAAVEAGATNKVAQELECITLTGVLNPVSHPQMMTWVEEQGLSSAIPNMQAETIKAALASGELTGDQHRALELRSELALTSAGKFATALECACLDGKVRGGFQFFGAHTGRWAGRGVQIQNLPRASLDSQELVDASVLDLKLGLGATPHTLKALVRAMFLGPFTVVDYAAIEARVVAWLAGEKWALDAFTEGRDIYEETAQRMGGLTRFQGKVAVLALGYNGAVGSLQALGAEGDDQELLAMVRTWRAANKRIVMLWSLMQDAVDGGGKVGEHLRITRDGGNMQMHLPSGRSIHYHGLRWEKFRTDKGVKEGWRYSDPKRGGARIGTYGGRLVENATQAVARDLLAAALVRLQAHGYTVAAHVHDEVVLEGEYDVEEVVKIMCELPDWATGLPMDAEGFTCERYRKG